jgi:hypothetical protein
MELDELKQNWQTITEIPTSINTTIMEQLQHNTYGPVATLKLKYLRQLFGLAIFIPLFGYEIITDPRIHHIAGLLMLLCLFLLIALHGFYNYRLLKSLQLPGLTIAATIDRQIRKLERSDQCFNIANRALLLVGPVVLEIVMYHHLSAPYESWYRVAILWRILTYVAGGILLYYFDRYYYRYRIGRHLENLKKLNQQLSE